MKQYGIRQAAAFLLVTLCALGTGGWISGRLQSQTICTRQDATKATIAQVCEAVDLFNQDQRRLPEHLKDLVACPAYVESQKWPPGGYLYRVPRDSWERDFILEVPGTKGRRFNVISLGADGRFGGKDQDQDLENVPERD